MITAEKDYRVRIRLKAEEMFMKYGIRSVSMDDIANALGASKKTLYQYYSDKDELVDAVVDNITQNNEMKCDFDRGSAQNAIEEVFRAIEMSQQLIRNMNPSILFDLQKYHPGAFAKFLKHKNDYLYSVVRQNLERGIREELYRPDINVELLSRFRVESMMMPFQPDFLENLKESFVEAHRQIMEHFVFGVVSAKGYKLIVKYQQDKVQNSSKHETSSKAK